VEGLSHAEIARRSRSTAPAIGQLLVRARRSLGLRYLQAHLAGTTDPDLPVACAAARASLAELVRGTASARRRQSVTEHLAGCAACATAHDDLCIVNERLRGLTLLAVATTITVPKRWVANVAMRTGWWLLGSTAPLTAAATIVVATVAPSAAPAASPAPAPVHASVVDTAPAGAAPPGIAVPNGQRSAADGEPHAAALIATPVDSAVTALESPTSAPPAPPPAIAATPADAAPPATAAPPPATRVPPDSPDITVAVAVDAPAVRLPSLPLIDQLSDTVDVPPVALDVTVGDAVEADVSVGGASVGAAVGGEGVTIDVGGSVEAPIVEVPPIEIPPIEVPIDVPILGG
jgi:hypothetical protein